MEEDEEQFGRVEHGLPNSRNMGGNAYAQRKSEIRNSFFNFFLHIAP